MPFELVPVGTHIDFIGKRRLCAALSIAMLLAGLAAIPLRGIQLGIDFAGGTELQVRFASELRVGEGDIRSVVARCGVRDPSVVRYGETSEPEFLIRFRALEEQVGESPAGEDCPLSDEDRERLAATAEATGGEEERDAAGEIVDRLTFALGNALGELEIERVEFVGPLVGHELRRDGMLALAIACLLILLYIAFRFSARFAPGAIVALVHDVGVTAGIFVMLGLEFDLRVLAALLAILGYSLNDTIIIYDRIRENMALHTKHNLAEVLNLSVNQTLSRTVLTSGTTLVAVLALLILGGTVIRSFAIAMVIGVVVGTYSSIFIAAATLLWLETRFGKAEAVGTEGGRAPAPVKAAARREATKEKRTRPKRKKKRKASRG